MIHRTTLYDVGATTTQWCCDLLTGGAWVQTIVRWIHLFSLLTYLLPLHTTNRPRQSKFTMLLSLNYINETMYYWGVNSKMQTSHTLCSRPKRSRYGAMHHWHWPGQVGMIMMQDQTNKVNLLYGLGPASGWWARTLLLYITLRHTLASRFLSLLASPE